MMKNHEINPMKKTNIFCRVVLSLAAFGVIDKLMTHIAQVPFW